MVSAEFQAAAEASRQLEAKPSDDELLQLYALYKQALQDPPIEKAENPGMFDLKGKAKKRAWQKIVDEGVTPSQAEEQYITLVESLKAKYGYDATKVPEAVGGK